jgi:cytochrome b561
LNKLAGIADLMRHRGRHAVQHTWSTRWVHWTAAALLAFGAIANGDVTDALFSPAAMRTEVIAGIGITALYAYLWFWVRGPGGGSRLPADAPGWERRLAKIVHLTIYGSIAAVLLTGFGMAWLAPTDLVVDVEAHRILGMTRTFSFIRESHEFASGVLGWAFGLHLCGALWHRVVRRDGVTQSISLLGRKTPTAPTSG